MTLKCQRYGFRAHLKDFKAMWQIGNLILFSELVFSLMKCVAVRIKSRNVFNECSAYRKHLINGNMTKTYKVDEFFFLFQIFFYLVVFSCNELLICLITFHIFFVIFYWASENNHYLTTTMHNALCHVLSRNEGVCTVLPIFKELSTMRHFPWLISNSNLFPRRTNVSTK